MVIIWYPAHIPVLTKIEDELQKKKTTETWRMIFRFAVFSLVLAMVPFK